MEGNNKKDAIIFKALCDEKRLGVLKLLRSGERCACELLEDLNMSQSALSYHMKILCESGIVTSRQEGKWTHYQISREGSEEGIKLMTFLTTPNGDGVAKQCK